MTEIKLKPCPFCGGEADFGTNPVGYRTIWVRCKKCKISTASFESNLYSCAAEKAAEVWNNRNENSTQGEWESVNSYEAENKERKRKVILKKLREAQDKYDEAERNYQDTGSSSTMRTMHRHEEMVMICGLALQALDNVCGKCESRRRNATYTVNKYKEAQKSGNNDLLDFDKIISDFIDLQY